MKSMGTRAAGARLERMKASPLWAGDRFQNVHPVLPNLRDPTVPMPSLKDFMCGGERRAPRGPLPSMSPLNAWAKKPQSGLRVTWLGHSTMLIEIDGVRILTDPVWGPRASPAALIGPKRFQPVPSAGRSFRFCEQRSANRNPDRGPDVRRRDSVSGGSRLRAGAALARQPRKSPGDLTD